MSVVRSGPRKQPRQERSRATVDRILDAAARVLIAYGYDGASTNRIARAAGVSPGSLYQYFSDKDAITAAVVDKLAEDINAGVATVFRSMAGRSAEDGTRAALTTLVNALAPQADLLRIAVEQVPRFGDSDRLAALLARGRDLVYHQLLANQDRLRHHDLDTTTWFVVHTTTQMTIRYTVDRPPIPADRFVDELSRLLLSYVYRD
ncbi:MAG: TetR/AcrR family transcriptional regulator [Mycobacterium sp.]|nr:TetR/AcrR family transcriptional regulator [Mycobacterium sp.]